MLFLYYKHVILQNGGKWNVFMYAPKLFIQNFSRIDFKNPFHLNPCSSHCLLTQNTVLVVIFAPIISPALPNSNHFCQI